jgi:hypothetical protein
MVNRLLPLRKNLIWSFLGEGNCIAKSKARNLKNAHPLIFFIYRAFYIKSHHFVPIFTIFMFLPLRKMIFDRKISGFRQKFHSNFRINLRSFVAYCFCYSCTSYIRISGPRVFIWELCFWNLVPVTPRVENALNFRPEFNPILVFEFRSCWIASELPLLTNF